MKTSNLWIGLLLFLLLCMNSCTCASIKIGAEPGESGNTREQRVETTNNESTPEEKKERTQEAPPIQEVFTERSVVEQFKADAGEPVQEVIVDSTSPDTASKAFVTLPGCNTRTACVFDVDCAKGLACHQGKCKRGSKCPAGRTCGCSFDSDCATSHVCQLGKCVKIFCKSDCDCGRSMFCNNKQLCVTCSPTCISNSDCRSTDVCQTYGYGCTRCITEGSKGIGQPCRTDSECSSKLCVLEMASAGGTCSMPCLKNKTCPNGMRCKLLGKEYCKDTSRTCGFCVPINDTTGCVSLFSCSKDLDCKGLMTQCSCCNEWRCNINHRCHMVFR